MNFWLRARVVLQGLTLVALLAGSMSIQKARKEELARSNIGEGHRGYDGASTREGEGEGDEGSCGTPRKERRRTPPTSKPDHCCSQKERELALVVKKRWLRITGEQQPFDLNSARTCILIYSYLGIKKNDKSAIFKHFVQHHTTRDIVVGILHRYSGRRTKPCIPQYGYRDSKPPSTHLYINHESDLSMIISGFFSSCLTSTASFQPPYSWFTMELRRRTVCSSTPSE